MHGPSHVGGGYSCRKPAAVRRGVLFFRGVSASAAGGVGCTPSTPCRLARSSRTSPTWTTFASSQPAYTIRNFQSLSRETVIVILSALKIGAIGAAARRVGAKEHYSCQSSLSAYALRPLRFSEGATIR